MDSIPECIRLAQREELCEERLGAFVPGVDVFVRVEPLFRLL